MALRDDQVALTDARLLGAFVTAVKAVAAGIVEELPETAEHAARMTFAKRVILEQQAQNYGRAILEIAIARHPKLGIDQRGEVTDENVMAIVAQYVDVLAREGW